MAVYKKGIWMVEKEFKKIKRLIFLPFVKKGPITQSLKSDLIQP